MSYRIVVERPAEKSLRRRIAPEHAGKIRRTIDDLADDPIPPGTLELRGRRGRRLRVGDYRVIYEIDDAKQVVTVVHVAHRRDVYRQG